MPFFFVSNPKYCLHSARTLSLQSIYVEQLFNKHLIFLFTLLHNTHPTSGAAKLLPSFTVRQQDIWFLTFLNLDQVWMPILAVSWRWHLQRGNTCETEQRSVFMILHITYCRTCKCSLPFKSRTLFFKILKKVLEEQFQFFVYCKKTLLCRTVIFFSIWLTDLPFFPKTYAWHMEASIVQIIEK